MIQILVLLEIKDKGAFKEFENKAIQIMKKYDGRLLSAFKPNKKESSDKNIGEIHFLEFPTLEAFNSYRADNVLSELKQLRDRAIAKTSVYISEKFIIYDKNIT